MLMARKPMDKGMVDLSGEIMTYQEMSVWPMPWLYSGIFGVETVILCVKMPPIVTTMEWLT